jgi:hypothetical protein
MAIVGTKKARESSFVDELTFTSIASHYSSGGSGSLCYAALSFLKIFEV